GNAQITGKLDEPGFLLCRVNAEKDGKPVSSAMGGAGVEPLLIKPSLPVPDDFDAFWADQKKKVAAVPQNPQLTPVKADAVKNAECFDVQLDCIGAPVSGYYCKPAGAAPKSLPAVLLVHGAGVRSAQLNSAAYWSNNGALAMDINAHGLPNGRPDEFYKDVDSSILKGYRTALNETREGCYYLGMFRRLMQALNFLCAQPEWDGKTLIVYGASQGGFQAFAAAALDHRVTAFAAGVPAGCDHTGMVVNRIAGWPKFPIVGLDGVVDKKSLEAARYFDCVNFAARTKAKAAIVTVGFIDVTCPPTSVYAAYNALPLASKSIYNDILSGHSNSPSASKAMNEMTVSWIKGAK
ncbi:MAG: acetylxylan esterase, partial [Verrucomicrobium sp.]|nr:acetylxylan esterase [Verrucomicrobium sp.]